MAGGAAMIHASPAQHRRDDQTPATRADPWTAGNKNGGRQPSIPARDLRGMKVSGGSPFFPAP